MINLLFTLGQPLSGDASFLYLYYTSPVRNLHPLCPILVYHFNEYRITNFGRGFPFLKHEYTGALLVFVKWTDTDYSGYVLNSEDDINQFMEAFGISPTETNQLIEVEQVNPEAQEQIAMQEFIRSLTVDFPD